MQKLLTTLLLLCTTSLVQAQNNLESTFITEFYDLLPNATTYNKNQVAIYNFTIKGNKITPDSSLIAQLSILENSETNLLTKYDTSGLEVTQFQKIDNEWVPTRLMLLNKNKQIVETSVINKNREVLSKVFYKYQHQQLVSEEAYTGYAYLDTPRRLSLIEYTYEGDKLVERDKKYSLNGTHWIQTWVYKFDLSGNKIWVQETNDKQTTTHKNEFEGQQLIRSVINITGEKPRIKELKYTEDGYPSSVYIYRRKGNKPLKLIKFHYQ